MPWHTMHLPLADVLNIDYMISMKLCSFCIVRFFFVLQDFFITLSMLFLVFYMYLFCRGEGVLMEGTYLKKTTHVIQDTGGKKVAIR